MYVGKAISATKIDMPDVKIGQMIALPVMTLNNNGSGSMLSQTITAPFDGHIMGVLSATYMNAQQVHSVTVNGLTVGAAYSSSTASAGGGFSAPVKKGDSILFSQGVSGAGTAPSVTSFYFQAIS